MVPVPRIAVGSLLVQGSVREGVVLEPAWGVDPICVLPREIFVACCQIPRVEGWILVARKETSCRKLPQLLLYKQYSSTTCGLWEKFGRNIKKRQCAQSESLSDSSTLV